MTNTPGTTRLFSSTEGYINSTFQGNSSSIAPVTINPWANTDPVHKVVEIIYLTVLTIVGTLGNLTVIFSIALENRIHSHGNVFVINLAIADLMITGFVVPTVIANVIFGGNALTHTACQGAGYIVTITCTCSLYNLTVIAINRYYAVVHSQSYIHTFTRKRIYILAVLSWVWAVLLGLPTFTGWSQIMYDVKMQLCSWDDTFRYSYTIFLTTLAIFIPLIIIFFCYTRLFLTVKQSGKWVRSLSTVNGVVPQNEQNRRSIRKEKNLLQTLATTVAFFCICWLPYGFTILIDSKGIPPLPKKIVGWLGLSNSMVNFVIYGVMNPVFRKGYRNLFFLLLKCERVRRLGSAHGHGSHSDSLYRSATKKRSNPSTPVSSHQVKNPNIIIRQSSVPSLNQFKTNSEITYTPQTTPQMEQKTMEVKKESPQRPASAVVVSAIKVPTANTLAVLKRPSNLLRKTKLSNSEKKKNDREARLKRNSLMLLQIEMSEEEDSVTENRLRTRSEIPHGIKKPVKKRSSSIILGSHSLGNADAMNFKNRKISHLVEDTKCSGEPEDSDINSISDSTDQEDKTNFEPSSPELSNARLGSIKEKPENRNSQEVDNFSRSEHLRRSMRQKEAIEGFVVGGAADDLSTSPEISR